MVTTEKVCGSLLISIRQAADEYGYPDATLYEMNQKGVPGFVRNGRNIRVHRQVFEAWLREQAQGSRDAA